VLGAVLLAAALRTGESALVSVCAKVKDGKINVEAKTTKSKNLFITYSLDL
jgi:hypothetical protein